MLSLPNIACLQPARVRRLALALVTVLASSYFAREASAETCPNGAEVARADLCKFFVKRSDPAKTVVDDLIVKLIPAHDALDPPVRSFALVVAVHSYPNFDDAKDRDLPPAKADLAKLVGFLQDQKFDEIIVLEDADATKANIEYFLGTYLNTELDKYNKRSRVLFAFTGHGAPPDRPGKSGALMFGGAKNSKDYPNMMALDELAVPLRKLGEKSYHLIALMGSCYSGGIFPTTHNSSDNSFFPRAPGAHAISATKPDDLAYGLMDEPGSVFFNYVIKGVTSGRGDIDYSGWAEDGQGMLQPIGGGIVRSGALAGYVSGQIDHLGTNPDTGKAFPQILFGRLVDDDDSGGSFFFLGPEKKTSITVSQLVPPGTLIPVNSVVIPLAGPAPASSIVSHPEIKVFNPPFTYPVQGVDVSHYDGEINWTDLAKKGGMQFAYMKATQGKGYVDPTFKRNWQQAKQAGMTYGAYHVFSFCTPAADQFNLIKEIVPKDPGALPIAIDVEWTDGPGLPGEAQCNDVKTVTGSLRTLEGMLREAYGKTPVIHGFTSTFRDVIHEFDRNAIWLQDWRKTPKQAGPSLSGRNPWSIWQFASNAVVPGINGHVDVNAFFGTEEQFRRFVTTGENLALSVAQSAPRERFLAPERLR